MTVTQCGNLNPWDQKYLCGQPFGHDGNHRWESPEGRVQAWSDGCHYDGDACGPYIHEPAEGEEAVGPEAYGQSPWPPPVWPSGTWPEDPWRP